MSANLLEEYLNKTGQSRSDLMAGSAQTGINYILDELIPKALNENKIIIWIDTDLETGKGEYILQNPS